MYREDFESIGGFNSIQYPEDYDLCFRMYANQIKVTPSLEILHFWRDHSERASRNDENYSDNRFLDLKVKYYIKVDHNPNENLFLWGAGKKGKRIAHLLNTYEIEFEWITNNEKKVGKHIYDKLIKKPDSIISMNSTKSVIIAVANEVEQEEIIDSLSLPFQSNKIYKFC